MTEIASIIKVFVEPGPKKDGSPQAALKPGARLTGKVTEILSSGLLQINFGKFRTQAKVRFPVARGDALQFEVLESGEQLKLKLQPPPAGTGQGPRRPALKPEALSSLRQLLETVLQNQKVTPKAVTPAGDTHLLLSRLSRTLAPLQPGAGTGPLAALLKAHLNNAGIFFEKRLETALLQIFKSPGQIDTGRALGHPFITHILDNDLKPNLIRLTALPARGGGAGNQNLVSLGQAARGLLAQIQAEQQKITGRSPAGPGKQSFAYQRTRQALSGGPKTPAGNPGAGLSAALRPHLVKSGLWANPDIRLAADALDRVHTEKTVTRLQAALARLLQHNRAVQPGELPSFIASFRTHIRTNQIPLDPATGKALENLAQPDAKISMPSAPLIPAEKTRQDLAALKRFIDTSKGPFPGKTRPATGTGSKKRQAFTALAERQAAVLTKEIDQLDSALSKLSTKAGGRTGLALIKKTALDIRAFIDRHQLPATPRIDRVLLEMTSQTRPAKTTTLSGLQPGPVPGQIQPDLVLLQAFFNQQKTELNANLTLLKGLLDRTPTEADPGGRPGAENAPAADPVQVVTFSLPLAQGQKPARLKVFYPLKKKAGTAAGFRMSLLLSMDRMGQIRTDIFTHEKALDIKFSTEHATACRHIDRHLKQLDALLRGHFTAVSLSAAVDEKTISAFEYEDMELSGNRMVDLEV